MNRTPYDPPYLLRGLGSRVYLGVYRGYYVLLGLELAAHNGMLLTRPQKMHTGLAFLLNFTPLDGSKVYVGVCLHAYLASPSSRDEQESVGLASIYRALGLHVMIIASAHFAADAICEGLRE